MAVTPAPSARHLSSALSRFAHARRITLSLFLYSVLQFCAVIHITPSLTRACLCCVLRHKARAPYLHNENRQELAIRTFPSKEYCTRAHDGHTLDGAGT